MPLQFGIEPPAWLLDSVSKAADPMRQVKEEQARVNLADSMLQMQMQEEQLKTAKQQRQLMSEDLNTIPQWLRENDTWEKRQAATPPIAKSPFGEKLLAQVELNDSRNSQRKIVEQAAKAKNDAAAKLTESWNDALLGVDDAQVLAEINSMGKGPVPTPQQIARMNQYRASKGINPMGVKQGEYTKPEKPEKKTAAIQNIEQLAEWRGQLQAAEQAGDTQAATDLKEKIQNLAEQLKGQQITLYDPQTGQPTATIGKGGVAGGLTSATQTQLQEKLVQYQDLNATVDELKRSIRPEDVGLRGAIGEHIVDKGLAQLNPKWASGQRITTRELISFVNLELLRKISNDNTGRFTVADKREAENAIVSLGPHESYPNIIAKLNVVQNIMSRRARQNAQDLGRQAPSWTMTDQELIDAYKSKKITLDDLKQESARRKGGTQSPY